MGKGWLAVAAALGLVVWLGSRPMKIPRDPGREGIEDVAAVQAYDRVSRWPLFTLQRKLVMDALVPARPAGMLLDIGCGPGHLAAQISRYFPDLAVIGLDISDTMLAVARQNWPASAYPRLDFLRGNVQRLPFRDATLDFVVSSLTLHHWADAAAGVAEVHRVLKPGGRFLVFDLRRDGPRALYYALRAGQALIAPPAIKATNGAVGSFWASYTVKEARAVLGTMPWRQMEVRRLSGWLRAMARKA